MAPTNQVPNGWGFNPWSQTGHKKVKQPDNAEYDINGTNESCLSVLNNVYNDGIAWHDVACYHEKPFVCEDSEELLNYVASTNRGIRLWSDRGQPTPIWWSRSSISVISTPTLPSILPVAGPTRHVPNRDAWFPWRSCRPWFSDDHKEFLIALDVRKICKFLRNYNGIIIHTNVIILHNYIFTFIYIVFFIICSTEYRSRQSNLLEL